MPDLSQSTPCDRVLIPDLHVEHESRDVALAWLRTIVRDSYESSRQQGNVLFAGQGLFDGGFDAFEQARSHFFERVQFSLNISESRDLIISRLSKDVVEKWLECIRLNSNAPSLYAWFMDDADINGGTICVDWYGGLGGAPLNSLIAEIVEGAMPPRSIELSGPTGFDGQTAKAIQRSTNVPLRVTLNGLMADGVTQTRSAALLQKYFPPPTILEGTFSSPSAVHLQTGEFQGFARGAHLTAVFSYAVQGTGLLRFYAATGPLGQQQLPDVQHQAGPPVTRSYVLTGDIPPGTPFTLSGDIRGDVTPISQQVKYRIVGNN